MAEAMLKDEPQESMPSPSAREKRTRGRKESGEKNSKTVVIQLPPKKRRKVSASCTIKHVVEEISNSVTREDRREAISTALSCLDHNEEAVHDEELAAGADTALTKHLGYLLCRYTYEQAGREKDQSSGEDGFLNEISCTCKALETTYRGSVPVVSESFKRIGVELMPLLLEAIGNELSYRYDAVGASSEASVKKEDADEEAEDAASQDTGPVDEKSSIDENESHCGADAATGHGEDGDLLLRKATKVLGHFARVGSATQAMASQRGLLPTLINLISIQPYTAVPAEARLNSLWIIANLACNAENMVMMACHPDLLTSLITIAARTVRKPAKPEVIIEVLRAQSIAVRALLNLSWAPENRIPMSEISDLVEVLSKLTVFRKPPARGRTVQDIVLQTRRQAVGALRNLAAAPRRNKIRLCNHDSGVLLNVLTDAFLNDSDEGVKKLAFCTINNLAVHDTARSMVEHPALVLALKGTLLQENGIDEELKASASGTMMVLERSITPDMDCYQNLRELLDAVNPTDSGNEDVVGDDMG